MYSSDNEAVSVVERNNHNQFLMSAHLDYWRTLRVSQWWPGPRPWVAPRCCESCHRCRWPGCPSGCPAHSSSLRCSVSRSCRPCDLDPSIDISSAQNSQVLTWAVRRTHKYWHDQCSELTEEGSGMFKCFLTPGQLGAELEAVLVPAGIIGRVLPILGSPVTWVFRW